MGPALLPSPAPCQSPSLEVTTSFQRSFGGSTSCFSQYLGAPKLLSDTSNGTTPWPSAGSGPGPGRRLVWPRNRLGAHGRLVGDPNWHRGTRPASRRRPAV